MRIFIASSNELNHERVYLANVVFYLGRLLHDMGHRHRVELIKWEYLDSSMGIDNKQSEYNRVLEACDAVIALFWRKFGEYTENEFLTALQGSTESGHPRKLMVLFKETDDTVSPQLAAYRESLPRKFGIKPQAFSSDSELRDSFLSLVFDILRANCFDFAVPDDDMLTRYCLR